MNIKNNTKACRDHVTRCSKLRELTIIHPDAGGGYLERMIKSDKIMSVVMKAKNTLTTLSVSDLELSNSSFCKISRITKLTSLDINALKIQSDGLSQLRWLSKLRSLEVHNLPHEVNCFHTLNDVVNSLNWNSQLEEVQLMGHRGHQVWTRDISIRFNLQKFRQFLFY